jgi:ubiquinone/menaquinone biosynthesis C-methylase UbiE
VPDSGILVDCHRLLGQGECFVKSETFPDLQTRLGSFAAGCGSTVTLTGQGLRPGGLSLTANAVEICAFGKGDLVLDAGCGHGMTLRHLAETHGIRSVGVDIRGEAVAFAHRKSLGKIPCVQSGLPLLPFRSGVFDGIFCECVLSVVRQEQSCLQEFARLLRPNGKLVLTDVFRPLPSGRRGTGEKEGGSGTMSPGATLTLVQFLEYLGAAGFGVEVMESHTHLMRQMVCSGLFRSTRRDGFWQSVADAVGEPGPPPRGDGGNPAPGYCMIIAGKYH